MLAGGLQTAVRRIQYVVESLISQHLFPPGSMAPALDVSTSSAVFPVQTEKSSENSFLESLKDGFLWGVPKKRKSLKKRKEFWYGFQTTKFALRDDIVVCLHCGNHHEAGNICGHCYAKVREETKKIQEAMKIADRVPRSQEVVVLYEGESADPGTHADKQIVELPNKRPLWFSPSLLTKVIEGKR